MRTEVRLAGFGGQGIIRAGLMLAMASSIYDNKNAVQTQSYGPESRGGSCKSEVVISDEEVDYPRVVEPDVLVTMSQEAFTTYAKTLKPGGTLLLDPDMVPRHDFNNSARIFKVPSTKIAEELGKTIVANVVMLGALFGTEQMPISIETVKAIIQERFPAKVATINIKAFDLGYKLAKKMLVST